MLKLEIEQFDKLAKLTDQLYAGLVVATTDKFFETFSQEIRDNFMWLLNDLTEELQVTIKAIDGGQETPRQEAA